MTSALYAEGSYPLNIVCIFIFASLVRNNFYCFDHSSLRMFGNINSRETFLPDVVPPGFSIKEAGPQTTGEAPNMQ